MEVISNLSNSKRSTPCIPHHTLGWALANSYSHVLRTEMRLQKKVICIFSTLYVVIGHYGLDEWGTGLPHFTL